MERYRADLDADRFIAPEPEPGSGDALLAAAAEMRDRLEPAGKLETLPILMALRSQTILVNETAAEAHVTLTALVDDLHHLPLDILEQACRNYVAHPGRRFFPKSSGELNQFALPILARRKRYVHRLAAMGDAAKAADLERARLEEPCEYTDDDIRMLTPSMRETAINQGWVTPDQVKRAVGDAA